jgi:hypothetical protein
MDHSSFFFVPDRKRFPHLTAQAYHTPRRGAIEADSTFLNRRLMDVPIEKHPAANAAG